jgi:hypothetical protein
MDVAIGPDSLSNGLAPDQGIPRGIVYAVADVVVG